MHIYYIYYIYAYIYIYALIILLLLIIIIITIIIIIIIMIIIIIIIIALNILSYLSEWPFKSNNKDPCPASRILAVSSKLPVTTRVPSLLRTTDVNAFV